MRVNVALHVRAIRDEVIRHRSCESYPFDGGGGRAAVLRVRNADRRRRILIRTATGMERVDVTAAGHD
jgi:hypothetical protein